MARSLRALFAATLAWSLAGPACHRETGPAEVADAFAEAYFRRMDQEKAKEFTALGASAMLDAELRDVAQIRKDGYTADDTPFDVTIRRGEPTNREQRIRIPYEIRIKSQGGEAVKDADIELAQIQGMWKVVRIGLVAR